MTEVVEFRVRWKSVSVSLTYDPGSFPVKREVMNPRAFLRFEGLTVLALCLIGYFSINGALWLLVVLALAPDLSMVGYLVGPRIGSVIYNIGHIYTFPLILGSVGFLGDIRIALLVALIWAGHIGADRLAGYGLKFYTEFSRTHLSMPTTSTAALIDSEE